jgi:hypothetical protein
MLNLPRLDTSTRPKALTTKGRARSSSIVKVEEVGNRSTEDALDRSAYANINADWVNAKGRLTEKLVPAHTPTLFYRRSVAHPRRSYNMRQNHRRHRPRHDPTNKLDTSQLIIPRRTWSYDHSVLSLNQRHTVVIFNVPLGHGDTF